MTIKEESLQLFNHAPVAYFCAELALEDNFPTYVGGLGVLAGDIVKQADLSNFPLIGIGLYYHKGYPQNSSTNQVLPNPDQLGLRLVTDSDGKTVTISIKIQDRLVYAKAWEWKKGTNSVFFLDTDTPENISTDRTITDILYVSDKETRLKQEIILGIGGSRLLKKLRITPSIYHLNEGHSGFLILELIRDEMNRSQTNFIRACEIAKKKVVFTNHTLVVAGQEVYSVDFVSFMLNGYAEELGVSVLEIINLGLIKNLQLFSMTIFSLRLSGKINTVSFLHNQTAKELWPNLKVDSVTNGIFLERWDKISSTNNLWRDHQRNKRELLSIIKEKTNEDWSENDLLIGWARRIVLYKRPLSPLEDTDSLRRLSEKKDRLLKFVFSGKVQNDDQEALSLFINLQEIIREKLKGVVVYLDGYGLKLAEKMVSGCDLWLNTPYVGSEACGTSGMKAALNGVLPISTNDGWVNEINLSDIGWPLNDENLNQGLLNLLEGEIIPLYYDHLKHPENSLWLNRMQRARQTIIDRFGAERALSEYIEQLYLPLIKEQQS